MNGGGGQKEWASGNLRTSFKLAATYLNPSSARRSALEGFFTILQTHFISLQVSYVPDGKKKKLNQL